MPARRNAPQLKINAAGLSSLRHTLIKDDSIGISCVSMPKYLGSLSWDVMMMPSPDVSYCAPRRAPGEAHFLSTAWSPAGTPAAQCAQCAQYLRAASATEDLHDIKHAEIGEATRFRIVYLGALQRRQTPYTRAQSHTTFMITVCAGRLTPQASVAVQHSTRIAPACVPLSTIHMKKQG